MISFILTLIVFFHIFQVVKRHQNGPTSYGLTTEIRMGQQVTNGKRNSEWSNKRIMDNTGQKRRDLTPGGGGGGGGGGGDEGDGGGCDKTFFMPAPTYPTSTK